MLRLSESASIVAANARRTGKKISGFFWELARSPLLTSRPMTRGSIHTLVMLTALGCGSAARGPAGGGAGGEGGSETGGSGGKGGNETGSTGGQLRADAALDLAVASGDTAPVPDT